MELDVKDEPVVFPFIGYYGTGRLWGDRRLRSELPLHPAGRATRYAGYRDCLDPRSNEKHMRDWIARLALIQAQRRIQLATLSAVYEAIAACVEGARAAEFDLKENDIVVEFEDGAHFPLGFLSDGQRSMVALAADIAMRCAQLNPHLNDGARLETPGVVLIDELDLHLHPSWQRHVVEDLMEAFTKLQFVATTHSPFFVQSMRRGGGVINLDRKDGDPEKIREKSIEDIAEDIMGVAQPQHSRRYMEMLKAAERYYTAIDDAAAACDPAEIEKLRNCLDELEEPFADDPAYVAFLRAQRAAKGRE